MANVLSGDKRLMILKSLVEGNSIRSCQRIPGVHRDTVMRLLVKTGEQCRAFLDDFPTPTTFTTEFDDVDGQGDLAFSRGHASAAFEDGTTEFRWMAIHRRQPDGSWKMVRDIWNT